MNKKFGYCFIGASRISYKVAREIIKKDNCYIASVWNRTYSKAISFANEFNAKAYEDILDAINDIDVEGVYISLTNDMHYEYMKLCINHHKNVICEKPFTMDKKEAEEIFDLAKKNNVYVVEAMWTWFNSSAYKVKEYIDNKLIGDIKEVSCYFGFDGTNGNHNVNRLHDINLLGGCLLDIGVYGIRYSLELFGRPNDIEVTANMDPVSKVDLNEIVTFIYDKFKVVHHFSISEDYVESYLIKGSLGYIDTHDFHMSKKIDLVSKDKIETFINDDLLYEKEFDIASQEMRKGLLTSNYVRKDKTIECMEIMDIIRKKMNLVFPKELDE